METGFKCDATAFIGFSKGLCPGSRTLRSGVSNCAFWGPAFLSSALVGAEGRGGEMGWGEV